MYSTYCHLGLNPFEVREVLQAATEKVARAALRLNPFEVREVLQAHRKRRL